MNHFSIYKFLLFYLLMFAGSTAFAQEAKSHIKEVSYLEIDTTDNDILAQDKVESEFASTPDNGQARGLTSIVAGYLISKGATAIQQMIDARKKKFTCQYAFAKNDLDFYDRVSTCSPFDPVGLRFRGFTVVRLRKRSEDDNDTVFLARFVLDTSKAGIRKIMNDGVFKLRLDSLKITTTQVKRPKHPKKINLDFEVDFTSSYRSMGGEIFADAPLGKFVYTVRDAPVDASDPNCKSYYDRKKNDTLSGECFIVPRSVGYFKNRATGKIEQCWGRGMYSIKVTVTETSKNKFIDKIIMNASDPTLAIVPSYLQSKMGTTSGTTSKTSSSSSAKTTSGSSTTTH